MPYSLSNLIKASGYAASAGQSFGGNVTGAGSGVKMSDYFCNAWTLTDGPDRTGHGAYSDGETFTMAIAFTQGSRAGDIKRIGDCVTVSTTTQLPGFTIEGLTSTVNTGATGTVTFTVRAPTSSGGSSGDVAGKYVWYAEYDEPDHPVSDVAEPVRFEGTITPGSNVGGDAVEVSIELAYEPDTGPFNPTLTAPYDFQMYRRLHTPDPSDYEWEWYEDSGYSTLLDTGSVLIEFMAPGDSLTRYLQYRTPGGSWIQLGALTFHDTRR